MWHVPQLVIANALGGSFKVVPYNGGAPAALAAAKKEVLEIPPPLGQSVWDGPAVAKHWRLDVRGWGQRIHG